MALLEVKNLEVHYGVIKALKDVSFEVNEGEIIALIGANGAGKSNFCKAIMQMQLFLSLSPILASNNPQLIEMSPLKSRSSGLDNPYRFNKMYADKPTTFSMEILLEGITYAYSFSTQSGKILEEKLTKKFTTAVTWSLI